MKKTSKLASFILAFVIMITTFIGMFPPLKVNAATETTYVKRYTVLVLDTSGTVTFTSGGDVLHEADPALDNVKKASKHFLSNIAAAEGDNYVAVVSYQETATIVSDFSKDMTKLNNKIDALTADNRSNISAGLEAANELLNAVDDDTAIKNIVLCTTGLTWSGDYSYEGKYDENVDGGNWTSSSTDVHIYAYANQALKTAEAVKKNANLYVLGLFQTVSDDMPEEGMDVVRLFQKTALDLASSDSHYHNIEDIDNIEFVFGELAETIISDIKGTFDFRPGNEKFGEDSTAIYYYRDSYFSRPSTYYSSNNAEIVDPNKQYGRANELYSFATMSLCLEMSAFVSLDITNYAYQSHNAKVLLDDIGFKNVQTNEAFENVPTANSIGVIIGQKPIKANGEVYTVLAVAMRGAGYEAEWAGNLNVGAGTEHTECCQCTNINCDGDGNHLGFYLARNEAVKFIKEYISENKISGKVKLWVTGFSRGGATSGLIGKWFDDHLEEANSWNIELTFDDIYAFTFEAPMSTDINNLTGKNYSNIFNILSPSDLVPKVAMTGNAQKGWNFARPGDPVDGIGKYNNNIVLPTKENNSNYQELKTLMKAHLSDIDDRIPYIVDDFKDYNINLWDEQPLSSALDKFLNEITDILDRSTYHEHIQPLLMSLFESSVPLDNVIQTFCDNWIRWVGNNDADDWTKWLGTQNIGITVSELEHKLPTILYVTLVQEGIEYELNDLENLVTVFIDLLGEQTDTNGKLISFILFLNEIRSLFMENNFYQLCECNCNCKKCDCTSDKRDTCKGTDCKCNCEKCICLKSEEQTKFGIFSTHYPEYCLAWMMSVDGHYQGKNANLFDATTRVIHINCPVNITVFNENGHVVAKFIDDVLQNPDETNIYAYVRNGEKVIYLPTDSEYSVVITATGEGAMSYSVEEYSTLNGESLRSVAYLDIPLYEGKTFNATVPEAMNASQNDVPVVYPLSADGEELTPNVDATADEVDSAKCNVEVQLDGGIGGIITGAEEYLIGTRANLTAKPFECYTFVGWFLGDDKVSDELQYSFVAKEDVLVTAKFAPNHTPNDDDGDCTTVISCSVCGVEIVAAQTHVWDNICDTECNNIGCNFTRNTIHKPNADDGDCSTAIICSVCGVEITAAQKHIWDDVSDKYCDNAGCEEVNPNYEPTDKNTDAKNFIDSIADKVGVTSDQLLILAGGSLAALVLLIIFIAAIKRKRR